MNAPVKVLLRGSSLLALIVALQSTVVASVDDAQSFALQAAEPYVKEGFQVREDYWGGDLGSGEKKSGPPTIIQRQRILVLVGHRGRAGEDFRAHL